MTTIAVNHCDVVCPPSSPRRPLPRRRWCFVGVLALWLTGCSTPPSVTPLLRVTHEALLREAEQQAVDLVRDTQAIDQTRSALRSAFAADLSQRETLDAPWVTTAAEAYASAEAALAEQRVRREMERATRADNLRAAAAAQQRAIELIEQQDDLLADVLGIEAWLSRVVLGEGR